jgi:hypothetical protein
MTAQTVVLRHATAADERALRNLAALDSRRLPAGPFLVAELDGELRSAFSLGDGAVIADPFRHTAHLVELLRSHAATQAGERRERRERRERGVGRRRRLRPVLGF